MTMNKVIEMNKDIFYMDDVMIAFTAGILWLIIGLSLLIHVLRDFKSISKIGVVTRVFLTLFILYAGGYECYRIIQNDYLTEKAWQKEYLQPYLATRPEQRQFIQSYTPLKEKTKEIKSIHILTKDTPQNIKIVYVNEKNVTKEIMTKGIIKKIETEKPYFTYKTIEKTISSQYPMDAFYDTTLYVPNKN